MAPSKKFNGTSGANMMTELAHPHDTALPITTDTNDILTQVDKVILTALEEHDPEYIIQAGIQLRMASQLSGLALAKLLAEGKANWDWFESDDDFATVAKVKMGIADQTYNKYTWVWEHVIQHPHLKSNPQLQEIIMGKPIGGLILLTAAARENQLREEDWTEIGEAPNIAAIRDVIARVRGHIGPAKHTLRLLLGADGTFLGKLGGEAYEIVGFVHRDETPLGVALIARLEKAGVIIEAK